MFHELEIVSNGVCDMKPDEALGKAGELFSGLQLISLINNFFQMRLIRINSPSQL
jgi:hypothetical protein